MRQPKLPLRGSCRCGATNIELSAAPVLTLACHCRDCQKLSASAYSLSALVPADGFKVVKGAVVARPLPGSPRHHHFCPQCMTWIYTIRQGAETVVRFRPTLLDDATWLQPFVEIMARDRFPWAQTGAVHRFEGFPASEDLGVLLEGFAEWVEEASRE